jgi:hypothetical protein
LPSWVATPRGAHSTTFCWQGSEWRGSLQHGMGGGFVQRRAFRARKWVGRFALMILAWLVCECGAKTQLPTLASTDATLSEDASDSMAHYAGQCPLVPPEYGSACAPCGLGCTYLASGASGGFDACCWCDVGTNLGWVSGPASTPRSCNQISCAGCGGFSVPNHGHCINADVSECCICGGTGGGAVLDKCGPC